MRAGSVRSRVAWVEYDRAPVNAFTQAMVAAVRDAVAAALADPDVRVIVLASAIPGYFSVGADLRAFKEMRGPQMRRWVALCHDLARLMRGSAKPLLAAIDGTAVGGGFCRGRGGVPRQAVAEVERLSKRGPFSRGGACCPLALKTC